MAQYLSAPKCPRCGQFLGWRGKLADHVCSKPGPRMRRSLWSIDSPAAKAYRALYAKRWREDHPDRDRHYNAQKEERRRIRLEAMIVYGGEPPKCFCFSEQHLEFLTLDH